MGDQPRPFGAAVAELWRDGRAPSSIARTLRAPFSFVERALLEAGISADAITRADRMAIVDEPDLPGEVGRYTFQPFPQRFQFTDRDGRELLTFSITEDGRVLDRDGRPLTGHDRVQIRWLHNPAEELQAGHSFEYRVELPSGLWPIDAEQAQRFAEDGATVYRRRVTDWTQVAP